MPCLDYNNDDINRRDYIGRGNDNQFNNYVENELEISKLRLDVKNLQTENDKISAYLCAILNELEYNNNLIPIILSAENNGKIHGIADWWAYHKHHDLNRITDILNKSLSSHEIELLKTAIKTNKI